MKCQINDSYIQIAECLNKQHHGLSINHRLLQGSTDMRYSSVIYELCEHSGCRNLKV